MKTGLIRSGITVSLNTFTSRILGLIRDIVIARVFGASLGVDAFLVAFRLPNLLRRLFAEGAFNQAFIPVLAECKERGGHDAVRDLASNVVGVLALALFVVTALGIVGAPVLVALFAFGFLGDPEKFDLTVMLVRVTFPYIAFISLTSFAGALLNTYGRFGVPAFTPVLLNLSLIGSALMLSPRLEIPILGLAIGVFIAGVVQLGFQLPFLLRHGLLVRPRLGFAHTGVRKVAKLILPATFGASVAQINLMVDTLIASFLVTGSVTWLYYSDRLVEFPLGVFGIALATVILPRLSVEHAGGDPRAFSATLDWALRLNVLIGVPAAAGLAMLAVPMLTTLFNYGAFEHADVLRTAESLRAYSIGLVAFIGIKILAPGFYARQDMRTPVTIGVVAMLSNIVLNLALVVPLAHAGLALATSLSAFLNAGLLWWVLRSREVYNADDGWPRLFVQVGVATLALVLSLWWIQGEPASWFEATVLERSARLTLCIGLGALCYVVALLIVGVRPQSLLKRPR